MSLRDEIFEQPEVLGRLLDRQREPARAMAARIRERGVGWAFLAARGSSDHAALYAKYLWGWLDRLPVALAAPSLFTRYRTPPRLAGSLVVGISQSGQSPDVVGVVEEGRAQGALTLAITNDPSSPLAAAAEMVLDTATGPERAVAATKTYTAQLLAVALLGAELDGDGAISAALDRVPELVRRALELEGAAREAASRLGAMERCVVLGRGFDYPTACEWSLKLKELARVVAEPYSPADFRHGPVALLAAGLPVLAVATAGAVLDDAAALLADLVAEHGAEPLVLSNDERALSRAGTPLPLPADLPEWLSPLVAIVPAQLFCYHLTREKGLDTESPQGLRKVTRTW